jgi:hypothetical protein
LDISGYNKTEEEARHDFEYALNEYVKFQMEHDTLNKDLERHGWEVKQRKAKGPWHNTPKIISASLQSG